jgi:hypothetical protein
MNALLSHLGPGGGAPSHLGGGGRNPSSNLKVQFEQVYKGERKDNLKAFLFSIEEYFELAHIFDDDVKIKFTGQKLVLLTFAFDSSFADKADFREGEDVTVWIV